METVILSYKGIDLIKLEADEGESLGGPVKLVIDAEDLIIRHSIPRFLQKKLIPLSSQFATYVLADETSFRSLSELVQKAAMVGFKMRSVNPSKSPEDAYRDAFKLVDERMSKHKVTLTFVHIAVVVLALLSITIIMNVGYFLAVAFIATSLASVLSHKYALAMIDKRVQKMKL